MTGMVHRFAGLAVCIVISVSSSREIDWNPVTALAPTTSGRGWAWPSASPEEMTVAAGRMASRNKNEMS